ncbi:MAG: glycosyltransferase family 4 protein [Planctomycetota bacterium]|nr:glycosyltransferase family 4 protein [Planctomycetota bacterium]
MSDARRPLLLAVSIPPPVTGQGVATRMLLRALEREGLPFRALNLAYPFQPRAGLLWRLGRALKVLGMALRILFAPRRCGLFYLQLGQSKGSLARDAVLCAAARLRRLPLLFHVHGGGYRAAYDAAPGWLRACARFFLRRARGVVVLSPGLRAMFDGLVEPARVWVVPNGVEEDLRCAAEAAPAPDYAAPELRALFLSNLIESKGYVEFLELARRARDEGLPVSFSLAGNRTEESTVDPEAFAREHRLERLEYAGPVGGEAKAALLARSHLFVFPTRYPVEGQPISILEAFHFGLAVLSTPAGGIPDVVAEGRNGFLVAPGTAERLLPLLRRLADDRAELRRIGEANRAEARARYTEAAHAAALLDCIRRSARS